LVRDPLRIRRRGRRDRILCDDAARRSWRGGRLPRLQAARLAGPGLFMAGFSSSLLVFTLLRDLLLLMAR